MRKSLVGLGVGHLAVGLPGVPVSDPRDVALSDPVPGGYDVLGLVACRSDAGDGFLA
jgi:hypothetical protein